MLQTVPNTKWARPTDSAVITYLSLADHLGEGLLQYDHKIPLPRVRALAKPTAIALHSG